MYSNFLVFTGLFIYLCRFTWPAYKMVTGKLLLIAQVSVTTCQELPTDLE